MVDDGGVVVEAQTGPANEKDDARLEGLLLAFEPVADGSGRAVYLPPVVQGDKGYGYPYLIALVRMYGVESQLSPRGQGHGSGLGKTRYVVERTLAWFENFRRINRCYEAKGEHFDAFNRLAGCVINANKLRRHRAETAGGAAA
jgi:transposase